MKCINCGKRMRPQQKYEGGSENSWKCPNCSATCIKAIISKPKEEK